MNSDQEQMYPKMVNFEYHPVPAIVNTGSQPLETITIPQYNSEPEQVEQAPTGYKQRAVAWVQRVKASRRDPQNDCAKKRLRRCTKCHVFTGYLMIILSALNFLGVVFAIMTKNIWSQYSISGTNGSRIDMEIPKSVYILMLIKTLFSVILFKIGRHALKTFKPIVADIKKEEVEGVVSSEKRSESVLAFAQRTKKLVCAGFVLFIISFFVTRCFITKGTHQLIEKIYDSRFEIQTSFIQMKGEHPHQGPMEQDEKKDQYHALPSGEDSERQMPALESKNHEKKERGQHRHESRGIQMNISNTFTNKTQDISIQGQLLGMSSLSFDFKFNSVSEFDLKRATAHGICHMLYMFFLHAALFAFIPVAFFMCSIKRTLKGLKKQEKAQRQSGVSIIVPNQVSDDLIFASNNANHIARGASINHVC